MTREKAIDILNSLKNYYNNKDQCGYVGFDDEDNKALDMAIKALKKEPCDDWHDAPSDEMTLEQAREFLQDRIRFIDGNYPEAIGYKQALKTAVRELGKQQCEDCISREAAIRWVKTECNPYGKPTLDFESGKKIIEYLEQMPSVAPQQKVGRWIMKHRSRNEIKHYTGQDEIGETHTISVLERYEVDEPYCSECGKLAGDTAQNYCCYCGEKMEVEDEKRRN